MTGRLKDLSFGRNGEQIITLAVDADFTERFDELKDFDVDIEIKKHRKMRSNCIIRSVCPTLVSRI